MKKLSVCVGSSCHLKGSFNVIQSFQQLVEEEKLHDKIEMEAQFCMRECQKGVSASIDGEVFSVSPENVREVFRSVVMAKLG